MLDGLELMLSEAPCPHHRIASPVGSASPTSIQLAILARLLCHPRRLLLAGGGVEGPRSAAAASPSRGPRAAGAGHPLPCLAGTPPAAAGTTVNTRAVDSIGHVSLVPMHDAPPHDAPMQLGACCQVAHGFHHVEAVPTLSTHEVSLQCPLTPLSPEPCSPSEVRDLLHGSGRLSPEALEEAAAWGLLGRSVRSLTTRCCRPKHLCGATWRTVVLWVPLTRSSSVHFSVIPTG